MRYKIILKLANRAFLYNNAAFKSIFEAAYCQGKPFSGLVFVCFGETHTRLTVSVGRMLLLEKKGRGGGGGKGERKSYKACASPRSPRSVQKVICLQEEDTFFLFFFFSGSCSLRYISKVCRSRNWNCFSALSSLIPKGKM